MKQTNKVIQSIGDRIKTDTVLFFDMDGTLVDTDYANYLSFKFAIQSVLNPINLISFNPKERFNRTILQREFPKLNSKDFIEIIRLKEIFYLENIEHTKIIPVVNDILNEFYKTNATVLVTNCRQDRALFTLNQHGLTDKFNHKFFRKSIDKDKHVNKFKHAITTLNLEPHMTIAFENEQFEIDEAIRAGIPFQNLISI